MEYIYMLNTAYKIDGSNILNIYGDIVIDVYRKEYRSYEFTHKKTGVRLWIDYGWAFAENTKRNRRRIKRYNRNEEKLKQLKLKVHRLNRDIITLEKQ